MNEKSVEFRNKVNALPGTIAGAAIAIGVPAVTLIYGQHLAPFLQLMIVVVGVVVGGLIALTATFFSLVMPTSVNKGGTCWNTKEPEDNPPIEKG